MSDMREPLAHWPVWLVGVGAVQWALGRVLYPESWLFVCAFAVVWVATILLVGASCREHGIAASLAPLAVACVAASLTSALIQTLQLVGWDEALEPLVFPMAAATHSRPYGNLAQPNLVATLHGLGLCAAGWLFSANARSGRVRRWVFCAAVCSVWGLSLSGSRTALLFWLPLAFAWWWGAIKGAGSRDASVPGAARVSGYPLLVLFSAHLVLLVAVAWWQTHVAADVSAPVNRELASASPERLTVWKIALLGLLEHPWLGYGPGGYSRVFFAQFTQTGAHLHPAHHAHNLVLQVAVEYGIPLTLLLIAVLGWRLWRLFRRAPRNANSAFAWGAIGVLLVHSQLEFPLWYLHFFVVLAWVVASLTVSAEAPCAVANEAQAKPSTGSAAQARIAVGPWLALTMLGLATCVVLMQDQWAASRRLQAFLSTGQPQPAGFQGPMFRSLHQYIDHASLPLALPLSDEELAWRRAATVRRPFPNVVLKLALAELAAGHIDEADRLVRLYRQMYPNMSQLALDTMQPLCQSYRQPQVCRWRDGWREMLSKQ